MSSGREAMLGRIREALETANLPAAVDILPPPPPLQSGASPAKLAEQFTVALEAVDGQVVPVANDDEARQAAVDLIGEYGDGSVLAWPDSDLPLVMWAALESAEVTPVFEALPEEAAARHETLVAAGRPLVGLTGALAGLADTGSLALLSGAERPMMASLLPETHIALLRRSQLLPDMATFLQQHHATESTATSRNLVFVTGPSRTADIELTLTRGVHGPKQVIVILID